MPHSYTCQWACHQWSSHFVPQVQHFQQLQITTDVVTTSVLFILLPIISRQCGERCTCARMYIRFAATYMLSAAAHMHLQIGRYTAMSHPNGQCSVIQGESSCFVRGPQLSRFVSDSPDVRSPSFEFAKRGRTRPRLLTEIRALQRWTAICLTAYIVLVHLIVPR